MSGGFALSARDTDENSGCAVVDAIHLHCANGTGSAFHVCVDVVSRALEVYISKSWVQNTATRLLADERL